MGTLKEVIEAMPPARQLKIKKRAKQLIDEERKRQAKKRRQSTKSK
jgi:hypothetical protein